jgi:hypothetical protein
MMCTPSKKFSWLKKMNAKVNKSMAKEGSSAEEPRKTKTASSESVEIVRKSE